MGFFNFGKKKKKETMDLPVMQKDITDKDIAQQRKRGQFEMDKIDIEAMKSERKVRRTQMKTAERNAKIDGVFSTIDKSLSFISDAPLKDPAGGKKKKSSLDDPFGPDF